MNSVQIEENVKSLLQNFLSHEVSRDDFVYELLLSYGHRKSVVSRVKTGERNLSKVDGEVILKRHLFFKPCTTNLFAEIDALKKSKSVLSNKIRFVIVTDYNQLIAVDMKTQDTLDIELNQLPKHFDFFLPWAGTEKLVYRGENPADVKAAEKMADLFDHIKEVNYPTAPDKEQLHELVVFLNRLLFCFFAEDTKIFEQNQFSNLISLHTQEDGSDLNTSLERLFEVLNTAAHQRSNLPQYLQSFPYVNGGLFNNQVKVPKFNAKARRMLLESGTLNWADINPDIFGSMIQGVADAKTRSKMGMHYTSVTNIMKVIEPLFLNNFYDEFDKCKDNINKLKKLQVRLSRIKVFDPACGSGNFLIIAYKEIRQLEIEILKRIQELEQVSQSGMMGLFDESHSSIRLEQFFGIELDDFAHEMAVLSLWLVEHQMNMVFETEFGYTAPTLPLKQSGRIVAGNAAKVDWEIVCSTSDNDEVYILGNPPYIGARNQSPEQKQDMKDIYDGHEEYKNSDYVSCWFLLGSKFIKGKNAQFAFVSTNSICQGEQVSFLWKRVFALNLEISFAHQNFKWKNNAKKNAGVTCVIVGVSNIISKQKLIFIEKENVVVNAKNISPYLFNGESYYVSKQKNVLSGYPKMSLGNMARDGGNLILNEVEKNKLIDKHPECAGFIRKLYGSQEWIKGQPRFALWITDKDKDKALSIPEIKERVQNVFNFRMESKAKTTNQYAKIPHMFAQRCAESSSSLIVPRVTSERRKYIPVGFVDNDIVVSDSALLVPNVSIDLFGILSSLLHVTWVKTVGGQLETRIRYSAEVCYNTFPVPLLSESNLQKIENSALKVIETRESHPDKNIEFLYDPDTMPEDLKLAHTSLDEIVEVCFFGKVLKSDEERMAKLFTLHQQLMENR
jgi:hypothetical protein